MRLFSDISSSELVDLLNAGAVGVLPTDTVYGLVCRAADEKAVTRLYSLKNRQAKPGTIVAANIDQLVSLGIKARYLKPVADYWPNPISIVIPNHELTYIHSGLGSIAVRIPDDSNLQSLLQKVGPLLTSSANQPGEPEAINIQQAQKYFEDKVDFYVDGGDMSGREASTVIRVVDDAIEVLRHGAVKIDEAGRVVQ